MNEINRDKNNLKNVKSYLPEEVEFGHGQVILEEGTYNSCAYRILEGEVEVMRSGKSGSVTVARLQKGAVFGEMSLIDNKPHSATVKAAGNVRLLKIHADFYKREIEKAGPIINELMLVFNERLRKATNDIVFLTDAEQLQRQISEASKEELYVNSHIAKTSIRLQSVFDWEEAADIVKNSIKKLGFSDIKRELYQDTRITVNTVSEINDDGEKNRFQLDFCGKNHSGIFTLSAPGKTLKNKYKDILMIYAGLLSSCLMKYESYSAFSEISGQVRRHISETRIRDVVKDLKKAIEEFSNKNLDSLMSIPDRLAAGEKIDDISFEMTIGFQEIDRLAQEADLIHSVFSNILHISQGQTIESNDNLDRQIDQKGDQSLADEIFQKKN